MSDAWRHAICDRCWHDYGPPREPIRLREPEIEICCFCGNPTRSGIYFRYDPSATKFCAHVHAEGGGQ